MEFTIPQFIEKEAKIVGPLTFKQFAFFGVAVAICVILYFILPPTFFFILCVPLLGGAGFLAFYKKEGVPLPGLIVGWFLFLFKPKIYLWKKKGIAPKFFKKEAPKKEIVTEEEEEIRKGPSLKMHKGSRLNKLFTRVETKN